MYLNYIRIMLKKSLLKLNGSKSIANGRIIRTVFNCLVHWRSGRPQLKPHSKSHQPGCLDARTHWGQSGSPAEEGCIREEALAEQHVAADELANTSLAEAGAEYTPPTGSVAHSAQHATASYRAAKADIRTTEAWHPHQHRGWQILYTFHILYF